MKHIELPRRVLVGDNALEKIPGVVSEFGLKGWSMVVADEVTRKVAGDSVAKSLGSEVFLIGANAIEDVERLAGQAGSCGFLVACGGGTVNDIVKVASSKLNIPYINVPTSASHDGIASPQASLKGDKPVSVKTHCPLGVVADTNVIRSAPKRLNASGCADVISNYAAVLDWKLAHREKGEYYGDYAAALSEMSANIVMENAGKIKDNINILVEALISSGVAIGIAGSSRPCSGSEHAFSHALDLICEKPALHGEQCGVGAIMMACLHKADWMKVKKSLRDCGAPTTAKQLGIEECLIIEALTKAHTVRERFGVLGNGLNAQHARQLAEKTGVI